MLTLHGSYNQPEEKGKGTVLKQTLKLAIPLAVTALIVAGIAQGSSSEPPKSDDGALEGVEIEGQRCGDVFPDEGAGDIAPSATCVTITPNAASRDAGLTALEAIRKSEGLDAGSGLSNDYLRAVCSELDDDGAARGFCKRGA